MVVRYRRVDGESGNLAAWEDAGSEGIAPRYETMMGWQEGDRIIKPCRKLRPEKVE